MQSDRLKQTLARIDRFEAPLCIWINQGAISRYCSGFFQRISRLGDGVFWYVVMALLPLLYGLQGVGTSLQMILAGAVGLVVYRRVKAVTSRLRPYRVHPGIHRDILPLDRFSFPSGHTLHAVSFSWLVFQLDPVLGWIVFPFAALVAISRVILGLHYPSDVLVGGFVGLFLAELTLFLW